MWPGCRTTPPGESHEARCVSVSCAPPFRSSFRSTAAVDEPARALEVPGAEGNTFMRYITAILLCSLLFGCGKGGPGTSDPRLQTALDKLAAATSPELRFSALGEAAKQSFAAGKVEDAQKYAQELMTLLPNFRQSQEYGNAAHDANLTLGRLAVREGRMDDAKRHLIESVRTPSARQMDYGPNMSLAKDLLEKGERQAVLDYFALCKKFWNYGRLGEWSQQVQEGKIPDFGANLAY